MLRRVVAPTGIVSWSCPGRVAAYGRSCHSLIAGVSLHARYRVAAPLGHNISLYCNKLPFARRLARRVTPYLAPARSCRIACTTVSWPFSGHTQLPSRLYVTKQFIVSQHTPPSARPSHVRHSPLREGRPCRRASWPCLRLSPWPYRGRPSAPAAPCVTIQSIVSSLKTENG